MLDQDQHSVLRVNNLVEVLLDLNPNLVADFQTKHPKHKDLLVTGVTLGNNDEKGGMEDLLELTDKALGEVKKNLPTVFAALGRKLIWVRRLRTVGSFVSIVASAGIVAAVYGQSHVAAITSAIITAISSTFTLLANNLEGTLLTGSAGNVERFVQLLQIDRKVFELNQQVLLAYTSGDSTKEQVLLLINSANGIAAEFRQLKMSLTV